MLCYASIERYSLSEQTLIRFIYILALPSWYIQGCTISIKICKHIDLKVRQHLSFETLHPVSVLKAGQTRL